MQRGGGEHCWAELLCTSVKKSSNISAVMWRTETQLDVLFLKSVTSKGLGLVTWAHRESSAAADIIFNLAVWDYV